MGERYLVIEYSVGKVSQPRRGAGGNWNFPVTSASLQTLRRRNSTQLDVQREDYSR